MARWLPRWFFRMAVSAASGLLALVVLSPWLAPAEAPQEGAGRFLALFARDAAVRRTAVAAALGLYVSAAVFFRPEAFVGRGAARNPWRDRRGRAA
jgi:hypothetical protein